MRKAAVAVLVSALLFSAIAGAQLVNSVGANPAAFVGRVPPDADTRPPIISILSPSNGIWVTQDNVNLTCRVNIGESKTAWSRLINEIYYEADWQQNKTYIFGPVGDEWYYPIGNSSAIDCNLSLTGIPEGKHQVTICTVEHGAYNPPYVHVFSINGSSSVSFTIDATAPSEHDLETVSLPNSLTLSAGMAVVAVVAVGILIYFKKRKHKA